MSEPDNLFVFDPPAPYDPAGDCDPDLSTGDCDEGLWAPELPGLFSAFGVPQAVRLRTGHPTRCSDAALGKFLLGMARRHLGDACV